MKHFTKALLAGAALLAATGAQAADWYPYDAAKVEPPFAADGKSVDVSYVPLEKATKPWNICVSFPHMKDAYWLGVDYGVAEEAKRLVGLLTEIEARRQRARVDNLAAENSNTIRLGDLLIIGRHAIARQYLGHGAAMAA